MSFIRTEFPTDIETKIFKQLNYALVLTYTKAAKVGQAAVIAALPHHFIIRNNFVTKGIKIEAATKQNPQSTVYARTDDSEFSIDFMIRQETGGEKEPKKGRHHLAIPTKAVKGKRDIVTKATRERVLKNRQAAKKRGIFRIDEDTPDRYKHGFAPGIYQRTGRKGRGTPKKLFVFRKSAHVEARFEFRETVIKAVQEALQDLFTDSLLEALRTAR